MTLAEIELRQWARNTGIDHTLPSDTLLRMHWDSVATLPDDTVTPYEGWTLFDFATYIGAMGPRLVPPSAEHAT